MYEYNNSCPSDGCQHGYEYEFASNGGMDSVSSEWNLVCEREGLHATVGAAIMVGYLLGGMLMGPISDRFGRRTAFVASIAIMLVSTVGTAVATNYPLFLLARSCVGFALAGVEGSAFVMGLELVGQSKRTLAGILCWFFETAGLASAPALAYLLRTAGVSSWRVLQMVYSAPVAIFLCYQCTTPESVRWLLAKGRCEEARRNIERTANINKVTLPEGMLDSLVEVSEKDETESDSSAASTLSLFHYPQMRVKTAILTLCWIVASSLYYVMLLDQSELHSDPYLAFLSTCAVQLPGYVFVIVTLERAFFGRRRSLSAMFLISGVALTIHPFLNGSWRVAVSVAGRFCANCSYTVLHLFSTELFPTVARGAGLGYCYVVSRVGAAAAPYVLLWLGADRGAPVLFGLGALLAGLAAAALPETLGTPLPDSMDDGEKLKVWQLQDVLRSCPLGRRREKSTEVKNENVLQVDDDDDEARVALKSEC